MSEDLNVGFFVTAMGRSGTLWLANLLDVDKNTKTFHEPVTEDGPLCVKYQTAVYDEIIEYFENRKSVMAAKIAGHNRTRWGEVNSYLRYFTPEIRQVFPGAAIVGLIRSGPLTVRSMYKRPRPFQELSGMERFEALCKYWAETYRKLEGEGIHIYRLEDINGGFPCFRAMCQELGLTISRSTWNRFAGKPTHVGISQDIPFQWTDVQWRIFNTCAGDVQARHYPEP